MKKHIFLILLNISLISFLCFSQCPPPGFPHTGDICTLAPILCADLNGYCATLGNNNITQPFPGCGSSFLNNDEWFAFVAGSTQITLQIDPSNCQPSNQGTLGMQAAIYEGSCSGPTVATQCGCSVGPFQLSGNFIVGQIYYVVLDGCLGSICDYSISVTNGSTVPAPPANPGPITGPVTVCQNTSNAYNITPTVGATIYNWTLTPPLGTIPANPGNNVNVSWGNTPGTTQLCVDVANPCLSNPVQSCLTISIGVPIVDTPQVNGITNICSMNPVQDYTISNPQTEVDYLWTVPTGCTYSGFGTNISVDFSGMSPGNGQICATAYNVCDSIETCISINYFAEQSISWTGAFHIWSFPQYWSTGYVPLPCNNISIPTGFVLVTLDTPALGKTLYVQLGARLEVPIGSIMTIE